MSKGVTYRQTADLIEVTFCRPERRNALGSAEWDVIDQALAHAEADPACEYVIIRGEGAVFCAGVDLKLIEAARQSGDLLGLIERNGTRLQRLEKLPQIVIVVLNGPAIGIGTHIALCADVILAHDSSFLWIPEARLGIADVLHYRALESRLGRTGAFSMMLLGEKLSAQDAKARGVVTETYPDEEALLTGIESYLARLRSVTKPVRLAFKRHAISMDDRSDPDAQLTVTAAILEAERCNPS